VRISANGIELEVAVDGLADGPAVLLLHGFPDSGYAWRHQVAALTAAGYRTIVPDQRGFGATNKPAEVEAYAMPNLAMDAIGVLDAIGIERASVVGHDWGAAVAWTLPMFAPDRVERLCAISVGHPRGFFREGGNEQREKSWYMLFFQAEGVAEEWLARDDFDGLRSWMYGAPDFDHWVPELSKPGALTAALNWYRANVSPASFVGAPLELPPITCPVLGIWGDRDAHLTERQMVASEKFVTGPWRYERFDGVDHWVPVGAAARLNAVLLDFLGT